MSYHRLPTAPLASRHRGAGDGAVDNRHPQGPTYLHPKSVQSIGATSLGPHSHLQREFAQVFFDIVPDRIAELVYCLDKVHATARDARLSEWCHAMRGTASIIGAPILGQLVETLASALETGSIETIRDIAVQITHELRRVAIDMDKQFTLTEVQTR